MQPGLANRNGDLAMHTSNKWIITAAGVLTLGIAAAGCSSTASPSNSPSSTSASASGSSAASSSAKPSASSSTTQSAALPACDKKSLTTALGNVKVLDVSCDWGGGTYYAAVRYENENGIVGPTFVPADGSKWKQYDYKNLCGTDQIKNWPADLKQYC